MFFTLNGVLLPRDFMDISNFRVSSQIQSMYLDITNFVKHEMYCIYIHILTMNIFIYNYIHMFYV